MVGKKAGWGKNSWHMNARRKQGRGEGVDGRIELPAGGGMTGNGQGREGKVGRRTGGAEEKLEGQEAGRRT